LKAKVIISTLVVLSILSPTYSALATGEISIETIVRVMMGGMSVKEMIDFIDSRDATFIVTQDDIVFMREAGLPDYLIAYIVERKEGDVYGVESVTAEGGDESAEITVQIGTINVFLTGEFVERSKSKELQFFLAIGVDGDIKTTQSGFDQVEIVGGEYFYSTQITKNTSISLKGGSYNLELYLWTGEGIPEISTLTPVWSYPIVVEAGKFGDLYLSLESPGGLENLNINVQ